MSDWVISTVDQTTMRGLMQVMGYWCPSHSGFDGNTIPEGPVFSGELPDNSGDYYLNEVGITYIGNTVQLGWWARLRLNGNDPFALGMLQIPNGVTIYPPIKLLSDGITVDPSYTQPLIGQIA